MLTEEDKIALSNKKNADLDRFNQEENKKISEINRIDFNEASGYKN